MRSFLKIIAFMALVMVVNSAGAQWVLLVEKPGRFKNYKYFIGDEIMVKTLPYEQKHQGILHVITDTSIVIDFDNEIMLDNIYMVLRKRVGLKWLSKITRIAGVGYFTLDVVNNAINNETIVDQNTAMISAGLVAFSYAIVPLHNRHMKTGEKWRIKALNMSMDEEVPNPFQR